MYFSDVVFLAHGNCQGGRLGINGLPGVKIARGIMTIIQKRVVVP